MHRAPLAVVCLVAACLFVTGCGSGGGTGPGDPGGGDPITPPGPLQTIKIDSLQVGVASAAGFRVLPLTSSGPIGILVLHGSAIYRMEEMGYEKIAFARRRFSDATLWNLWTMNADGSDRQRLTNLKGYELSPSWSPDGNRIAYARYPESGDSEIRIYDVATGASSAFTADAVNEDYPAWSPDGTKIAYVRYETDSEIYVGAPPAKTGHTNLTNNGVGDLHPAWSPDGSKIVFSHYDGSDLELMVMDADGSDKEYLTSNGAPDTYPDWSPDGTKIAWSYGVATVEDIWVMNADGSGSPRQLTDHPNGELRPRWSPDSRRIVYEQKGTFDSNVYVMDADGSNRRKLSDGDDEQGGDWYPQPSVVRSLIGAPGSDGGSDPPFGSGRPLAIAAMGPDGLVSAATITVPAAAMSTVKVEPFDDFSTTLTGLAITATRINRVVEDRGRGVPRIEWDVTGPPKAGAVLVLFNVQTGRIASVTATSDGPLAVVETEAGAPSGQVALRGQIVGACDARDPSRNLVIGEAREIVLTRRTGEVVRAS